MTRRANTEPLAGVSPPAMGVPATTKKRNLESQGPNSFILLGRRLAWKTNQIVATGCLGSPDGFISNSMIRALIGCLIV